jgi:acyl-homoserine-lactone acylase
MFMTWDKAGRVSSHSVVPFGASNRPTSPHYADQAPLFAAHKTKPVLFDPAALMATKPRVYRP